jgi:hypothetical protein
MCRRMMILMWTAVQIMAMCNQYQLFICRFLNSSVPDSSIIWLEINKMKRSVSFLGMILVFIFLGGCGLDSEELTAPAGSDNVKMPTASSAPPAPTVRIPGRTGVYGTAVTPGTGSMPTNTASTNSNSMHGTMPSNIPTGTTSNSPSGASSPPGSVQATFSSTGNSSGTQNNLPYNSGSASNSGPYDNISPMTKPMGMHGATGTTGFSGINAPAANGASRTDATATSGSNATYDAESVTTTNVAKSTRPPMVSKPGSISKASKSKPSKSGGLISLDGASLDDLLKVIANKADHRRVLAAEQLREHSSAGSDPEVTKKLAELLKVEEITVRAAVAKALEKWYSPEIKDIVFKNFKSTTIEVHQSMMKILASNKVDGTAPLIASRLSDKDDRKLAMELLISFGEPAQPAVIALLGHEDSKIKMMACDILKEIGTDDARTAMKKAVDTWSGTDRITARKTLQYLEANK